ncbi:hypothetical protein ABZ615_12165, partial [Streptomyces sp. NPDC007325]
MNRRRPRATVRARFSVREVPGITVAAGSRTPLPYGLDGTARRTAQRALTEAGRAYLGGHVELRAPRHTPARPHRPAPARPPKLAFRPPGVAGGGRVGRLVRLQPGVLEDVGLRSEPLRT